MKRMLAIIMIICLMAGVTTGCGAKDTNISTSETQSISDASISEEELSIEETTSDNNNADIVKTSNSSEGGDISSDEEEIDWTREGSYFFYVQEALRKNPNLKELDGHTIEISEERQLILDGIDTKANIDNNDYICLPTEDGSYVGQVIKNRIYVVPSWYNGETADYESDYTDKDGVTTEVTYQIPFLLEDECNDDSYQYECKLVEDEDGILGNYYVPYTIERFMLVSLYCYGEIVESYIIEPGDENMIYERIELEAIENNRILINCGALWGIYDLESKSFELITKEALSCNYPIGNNLLYTDWNHDEYSCDWEKNSKSVKTGNKVIYYFNTDFELIKKDNYQDVFNEIQKCIRNGENCIYDYDIDYSNTLAVNGVKCGNIHLPYATEKNYNIMYSDDYNYSCWLIENEILTMYRYGEVVREYTLPEVENPGQWKIVSSNVNYHKDANEITVKNIIDTNNDGFITAKELNNAIVTIKLLLINNGNVYMLNQDGAFISIASGVVDYYEYNGSLYWMDDRGNVYKNVLDKYAGNILIGENAVGISKHSDRVGFIVHPSDSRANYNVEWYYLDVIY